MNDRRLIAEWMAAPILSLHRGHRWLVCGSPYALDRHRHRRCRGARLHRRDRGGLDARGGGAESLFHNFADAFHFAYQPVKGNGSITARYLEHPRQQRRFEHLRGDDPAK